MTCVAHWEAFNVIFRWNILLFDLRVTLTYSLLFLLQTKQVLRGEHVSLLDLLFHLTYWKREHWSSLVNCLESVWYLNVILVYCSNSLSLSFSRLPEIILCAFKIYDLRRRLSSFNTVEFYSHNSKVGVELLFWCRINNSHRILTIKRVVKRHIFIQTVAFS
jgi:hypothetical protein